jgi:hypothetical protein
MACTTLEFQPYIDWLGQQPASAVFVNVVAASVKIDGIDSLWAGTLAYVQVTIKSASVDFDGFFYGSLHDATLRDPEHHVDLSIIFTRLGSAEIGDLRYRNRPPTNFVSIVWQIGEPSCVAGANDILTINAEGNDGHGASPVAITLSKEWRAVVPLHRGLNPLSS